MSAADVATLVGTALGSAIVALRGRDTWRRLRMRHDGLPRCPVCGHRCVHCRRAAIQVSDPPVSHDDEEHTPRRRIPLCAHGQHDWQWLQGKQRCARCGVERPKPQRPSL